jgi:hypothetical protein
MLDHKRYYLEMLNSLAGVENDLVANEAPFEASEALRVVIRLCTEDFKIRFPDQVD